MKPATNCDSRKAYRVGNKLKQNSMKNLKKLTKKELKHISGGQIKCPIPADWCSEWCTWTAWQKQHCINSVLDTPCNC